MANEDRVIPASALAGRLDKVRSKIASLSQQIDDLRREEKILSGILDEAVDALQVLDGDADQSGPARQERTRGLVEAIMGLVQSKPGLSRDELVEALKYLNINPFNPKEARRTIFNNLGNQIRGGKVREDADGRLFPVGPDQGSIPV